MSQNEACTHRNWQIPGDAPIGCGRCLDCGATVRLNLLFEGLRREMEALIARATAILGKAGESVGPEPVPLPDNVLGK